MYDGTLKGKKTGWLMIEYTIPSSQLPLQDKKLDTWVICKLYKHNRKKDPNGGGAVLENQAIRSSSHSVVYEDAKGPIEIDNLHQDMAVGEEVQVLSNFSNQNDKQVYMPYCPGMEMSNCRLVQQTAQYGSSRLSQRPLNSQHFVMLPPSPSSFMGCARARPPTCCSSAAMVMSTPPLGSSATLSELFDSELEDISKVLEGSYVPSQSIAPTAQYDPFRLNQGLSNSQPQVVLPSPPLPFTRCAKAGPSTSYASAVVGISTPPPEFSTNLPWFCDLDCQDIPRVLQGNHAPLQSVAQTAQYTSSRLSQGFVDFQPSIALPHPPSPFIGHVEARPLAIPISSISTSTPPSHFSTTLPSSFDSGLSEISENLEDNCMPLQLVMKTVQCGPSRLSQGFVDSQLRIALPHLPSPFIGHAEAGPLATPISSISTSTPPSHFSTTLPSSFDSGLSEISENLEDNCMPLQPVMETAQCGPSRLSQGFVDSQPPVALPPPPSPFTGCANAGPSTVHSSALVSTSTPPPDFFTALLGLSDSKLPDTSKTLEDIEANGDAEYFFSTEEKLKEVLGDSWIEEI